MINWQPLLDRHIVGTCPYGKVWIRLDRVGVVSGVYTVFETTEKYLPSDELEETVEGAKLLAEQLVKNKELADEIAVKNRRIR